MGWEAFVRGSPRMSRTPLLAGGRGSRVGSCVPGCHECGLTRDPASPNVIELAQTRPKSTVCLTEEGTDARPLVVAGFLYGKSLSAKTNGAVIPRRSIVELHSLRPVAQKGDGGNKDKEASMRALCRATRVTLIAL